jgi:2-keto-4-pentenoate hydratase
MTEDEMAAAVAMLVAARRGGGLIEALNATPASAAQGHEIQDRVAMALGEPIGGFKANAPPRDEPVRGLIYASAIFASPARLAASKVVHEGVEGEIAFRFLRDLPPRAEEYARAEVVKAMSAFAAIEVVSGRFSDRRSRPPMEQLADCLLNGALVLGGELVNWARLDIANLRVRVWVNGEPVLQHVGGHPIGDPVGVAVALVNLMRHQTGVTAGQVVTTGSCTRILSLQPGDRYEVEFEELGGAELVLVETP